jgi:hypothetical protein
MASEMEMDMDWHMQHFQLLQQWILNDRQWTMNLLGMALDMEGDEELGMELDADLGTELDGRKAVVQPYWLQHQHHRFFPANR